MFSVLSYLKIFENFCEFHNILKGLIFINFDREWYQELLFRWVVWTMGLLFIFFLITDGFYLNFFFSIFQMLFKIRYIKCVLHSALSYYKNFKHLLLKSVINTFYIYWITLCCRAVELRKKEDKKWLTFSFLSTISFALVTSMINIFFLYCFLSFHLKRKIKKPK